MTYIELIGKGELNHLTTILILPLTCGPKLTLNSGSNMWDFKLLKWEEDWRLDSNPKPPAPIT